MINWLTDYIGTGAYDKVVSGTGYPVLDARGLVDKSGNSEELINQKIAEGLALLETASKIVVCCDYGMSRSNSLAAGIIAAKENIPLSEVVRSYFDNVSESGVKLDMFHTVFEATQKKSQTNARRDTILITGASGFLGKDLLEKLSSKRPVLGLSSEKYNLLTDPLSLDIFLKENSLSTIIHLANPRIYTLNMAMGDSLVMLKNILELCRINKVKLVYVSSWEVYSGYNTEQLLADENLPLFPRGSYGESKWLCEQLITQYGKLYSLEYNIIRSSPVYGEGSDKPKFIYNFINKAKRNETITTHEYMNGFPKMDLLHKQDIVSAVEMVIDLKGQNIFNAGSGISLNTNEIAKMIIGKFNSKSKIELNHIRDYYPNIQMNWSKINKVLGWSPKEKFKDFISGLL